MKKIVVIDAIIMAIVLIGFYMIPNYIKDSKMQYIYYIAFSLVLVAAVIDLIVGIYKNKRRLVATNKVANYLMDDTYAPTQDITEILLLNEYDEPIKAWNLEDCVSLLIGRENPDTNVDIDLEESEYSALIDYNHAVLNYACGNWFVEDLYSENGVRVQTKEDGQCYKLAKDRPCKLSKGDIILIANTKLLMR